MVVIQATAIHTALIHDRQQRLLHTPTITLNQRHRRYDVMQPNSNRWYDKTVPSTYDKPYFNLTKLKFSIIAC